MIVLKCLAFYGGDVMDKEIKCILCGTVEISKMKRVLGQRTGSKFYFIHHECGSGHKFHSSYSNDPSHPQKLMGCNCSTEASVPPN